MKLIYKNIIGSLDTYTKGFSGRKLTAFSFVMFTLGIEGSYAYNGVKRGQFLHLTEVLTVNSCVILLCLSVVTAQHIINARKPKENKDENQ